MPFDSFVRNSVVDSNASRACKCDTTWFAFSSGLWEHAWPPLPGSGSSELSEAESLSFILGLGFRARVEGFGLGVSEFRV